MRSTQRNRASQIWEFGGACALLLVLAGAGAALFLSRRVVRPVGFRGEVLVPFHNVTVRFDGDTCISIDSPTGVSSCCIGHHT